MRINSTSQSLAFVLKTLQKSIRPAIQSREAGASLDEIEAVLTDIFRRQGPQIELLKTLIVEGESICDDILRVIQTTATRESAGPDDRMAFNELANIHATLTEDLTQLCDKLSIEHGEKPGAKGLLRQAADWEARYYDGLNSLRVELPQLAYLTQPPTPELSREYLEKFLTSKRGPLKVLSLSRMVGGHGKQTYICNISLEGGKSEELVIRKDDPAPIVLRGMFLVQQEYALLKALSETSLPVPTPYELSPQVPGPDGVDGAFFTMQKMEGAVPTPFLHQSEAHISETLLLRLAELLAKLHYIPLESFSAYIDEFDTKRVYQETTTQLYQRSLENWRKYHADTKHLPSPYISWLFYWLHRNVPQDNRRPVLTHGDFNMHNILAQGEEITAILDWECADFGAPEQDLAYIQPFISKHIAWERFLNHYTISGGQKIDQSHFAFCQAYALLKVALSFSRGTLNIQEFRSHEIRFHLIELGYEAIFMQNGLLCTDDPGAGRWPQKATGGQELMIFGDEANTRQKPGPQPNWQESVVIVWWDESNSAGGFHRLGHEPNLPEGGRITLWTHLITPQGVFKKTTYVPLRESDLLPGGSMGSGDDSCTHEFKNGKHIWTITEDKDDVFAKIMHTDIGPNLSGFPKSRTMTNEFASHHFDIPGTIEGVLRVKGHEYKLQGWGIRDHAWGPRDWNRSILSHRWVVGTCGEELSFVAVTYHSFDDKVAKFGWVVRHGYVTFAKSVDILTYMEADSAVNRGGRAILELDDGEELILDHTPVNAKASVSFHHGIPCVDRICTFVDNKGRRGFSNFESSSNVQAGTRRPGTLVDGIIDDGFWPA